MLFAFFADLPADAPSPVFTVALGIGACAAFFAVSLVVFLADGEGFSIRVVDAIHRPRPP
jgi:hypothetical protein